jgi:hypothetical protein
LANIHIIVVSTEPSVHNVPVITTRYTCAYCGAENEILVDPVEPGGGKEQVYEEECWKCFRANTLHIKFDEEGSPVVTWNTREDEY